MAETAASPPPAQSGGGGGPQKKAERWAAKHKVIVGAAGVGGAILLLSRKGGTQTIDPAAVAATSETGTTLPDVSGGGAEGTEPDAPLPADAPPVADTPAVELPPPDPGPSAPTPAIAAAPPPPAAHAPVPVPVISSAGPAASTPPSTPHQAPVTYTTVPGYYSVIQAYTKSSGAVWEWHHYTSGTRKGEKTRVNFLGNVQKGVRPPATDGWHAGTLNMGDYERTLNSVQYESTQQAVTNRP